MPVDWTAIRTHYEQGISQRSLATKYDVSQSSISRKAEKEQWRIMPRITPSSDSITDAPVELTDLSPVEIVEKALARLATFLTDDGLLTLNQHKLFADSLSQYIKLKLLMPGGDEQNASSYDMREFLAGCTDQELAIVRPVIAAVAARKQEAEEKIKPIRRIG